MKLVVPIAFLFLSAGLCAVSVGANREGGRFLKNPESTSERVGPPYVDYCKMLSQEIHLIIIQGF